MKSPSRFVGVRLAALFIAAWGVVACAPPQPADRHDAWKVKVGDAMPDFALPDIQEKWMSFAQDYKGRPLVISVFATWCPPCEAEMPLLKKEVWERFGPKGLAVVAVSTGEDFQVVRDFVQRKELSFDVLVDQERRLEQLLGGESIPRLIVVDRAGIIRHLGVGFDEAEFRKNLALIEQVVGEK